MRRTPWWGLLSATGAPLLLVGGWTVAAAVQPRAFDAVSGTISDLAALEVPHRWVMSVALVGVGVCHVATAAALSMAGTVGRALLATGGLATLLVATAPLPSAALRSTVHGVAAMLAFAALGAWPAGAARRHTVPVLAPRVCAAATLALAAPLAWLVGELLVAGSRVGLAERITAGAQAMWPLVVVVLTRGRTLEARAVRGGIVRAVWNGAVIAQSNETVVVEGNHYFPIGSVNEAYLEHSSTTTVCPWKGTAGYYTLAVDGTENPDAAWFYVEPTQAARAIQGHVAFWRGVTVEPD